MVIVLPTLNICIHGHLIELVVTLLNTNLQLSVTFQTPQYILADLEKMKKTLENSLKRPGMSWTKRVGTLILYTFTEYRSISDRMFTGYHVFVHLQNIDPPVTECSQVTVCLYIYRI